MDYLFFLFFIFLTGLVIGSFLGAYTYRAPLSKTIKRGRSFCPKCKKKIIWYDNIPLLSFLLLKGKCRNCQQNISLRYPLIELSTGIMFFLIAYFLGNCAVGPKSNNLCHFYGILGAQALPFLLLITSFFIVILVVDFENKIILDENIFLLFVIAFVVFLLSSTPTLGLRLFSAFASALFLLTIHLITKGKGMGLGDVKLAVIAGLILNIPNIIIWLYLSFILGAVIGIFLIVIKKARFGRQIPFAPFLVSSFFITLLWGDKLGKLFFPFLTLFDK